MIVVTGTKRSGTSMWMRMLRAAGFSLIGTAFPGRWERSIKQANPEGYFESRFRYGIYFRTNPDPHDGSYLFPHKTRRHVVKVFIPGLIRTDMAFIDRVVASMRHPGEYAASVRRLYAMEDEAHAELSNTSAEALLCPPVRPDPLLEWWSENFSLISDALTRRYPLHLTAYEATLDDPQKAVSDALGWLDGGDAAAAASIVDRTAQTQGQLARERNSEAHSVSNEAFEVFEALYQKVLHREPLTERFVDELNKTHRHLSPRIDEDLKRQGQAYIGRREAPGFMR